MYKVYLKQKEEAAIRGGSIRVYANGVDRIEGKDKNGSLAEVYSNGGAYIGKGYINHLSKILVRIFIRGDEEDGEELYASRILRADAYRRKLDLGDCYRMVFDEADDLPGLIIDRYGDIFVMQCLSLGIEQRKQLIVDCLARLFSPRGIYERSDTSVRAKEGLAEAVGTLYGEVPDEVIISENGLRIAVDVKHGQKTGYFLDQKENRFAARRYAVNAEVLDCFSNSGGFALNCATVAKNVTAVDISASALESVGRNAALNGLDNITTVQADVFDHLRKLRSEKKKFDCVILDPPAFCKSASEVGGAYKGYKDINLNAIKLVESGGYLITCSCSHHMTNALFERMLAEAAKESGRRVRLAEIRSQAPDHPSLINTDETRYLKCYILGID